MAWQIDVVTSLAELEQAYASGVKTVMYDGHRYELRGQAELAALREVLRAAAGLIDSSRNRVLGGYRKD